MPPKIETLAAEDVKLQAEILQLGKDLAARRTSSMRLHGQKQATQEEIEAAEKHLLDTIRSLPVRRLLGIRSGFVAESDSTRLRAVAYIGWEMLSQTSPGTQIEAVTAAIADPRKPFCEQVLLVRDALARMTSDRSMLVLSPENGGKWGGRLLCSPRVYSWLAGGQKSRADFCPAKQAADRLKSYGERDGKAEPTAQAKVPSAKEIYDVVRQKVVGLDPQVQALASQMSLHLLRCEASEKKSVEFAVPQAVVILIGPSSCGKTMLSQCVAAACQIPSVVFDATTLTSEGYIGAKTDDIFRMLVASAQGDAALASKASLAVIDEADKLDLRSHREVCSSAVQAELLRPLQGAEFLVGGKRQADGPPFLFNARNVAYILAGCYPDLDQIIDRKAGKRSIGFSSLNGGRPCPALMEAMREIYLEELCTRVSAVIRIFPPNESVLCSVTQNSILDGFNEILGRRKIHLDLQESAIRGIARFGLDTKSYFRGCKQVVAAIAEEILFESKPKAYVIGGEDVKRIVERLTSGIVQPVDGRPTARRAEIADEARYDVTGAKEMAG